MPFITPRANFQDIDGVLWGWQWDANQPNGHTLLNFSFPTTINDYGGYTSVTGFAPFNAQQQALMKKAVQNYDNVCNLDFVFKTDGTIGAVPNIRIAKADAINDGSANRTIGTALGLAPDPNVAALFAQGDTWFNPNNYNAPVLGTYEYTAGLLHEIGHTLGLKHGHSAQDVQDQNGEVLYTNPALSADHDSVEYSIMTYRAYVGAGTDFIHGDDLPSTLMQDDIFALQWMYGPNYDYNAGNTTYTWNKANGELSINGVGQGVSGHHHIFMTIWDGNGVDTYNFSNFSTSVHVNLAPGEWSTPSNALRAVNEGHTARGCIANALVFSDGHGGLIPNGFIENAFGGSGNDLIIGNIVDNNLRGNAGQDTLDGLDGNDVLTGGKGRDHLWGGLGQDVFDFNSVADSAKGSHRDQIMDFSELDGDKIDLRGIDANTRAGGNQNFHFIDSRPFHHHSGELRFVSQILTGDVNGDGKADFQIHVNAAFLVVGDFNL